MATAHRDDIHLVHDNPMLAIDIAVQLQYFDYEVLKRDWPPCAPAQMAIFPSRSILLCSCRAKAISIISWAHSGRNRIAKG
jgi:hypothetical protein